MPSPTRPLPCLTLWFYTALQCSLVASLVLESTTSNTQIVDYILTFPLEAIPLPSTTRSHSPTQVKLPPTPPVHTQLPRSCSFKISFNCFQLFFAHAQHFRPHPLSSWQETRVALTRLVGGVVPLGGYALLSTAEVSSFPPPSCESPQGCHPCHPTPLSGPTPISHPIATLLTQEVCRFLRPHHHRETCPPLSRLDTPVWPCCSLYLERLTCSHPDSRFHTPRTCHAPTSTLPSAAIRRLKSTP